MIGSVSIKALVIGVAASLVISTLLAILGAFLVFALFGEFARGVNFANDVEVQTFFSHVIFHPLFILFITIDIFVGVAIPAYLAAFVARRNFILHSMLIGGFISLLSLTDWTVVIEFPVLVTMFIVVTLITAFAAGYLRKKQIIDNPRKAQ
jgi:hypothetical protein